MRGWLGEPERFADPKFDTIAARYAASRELNEAIEALCAAQTMADLVAEGQRRGVPIAAVLTPAQALSSEHFRSVGALADVGPGLSIPVGPFVVDGVHAGYQDPAPSLAADGTDWATKHSDTPVAGATERPFDGMRILDLGVIVAGGELGRLFADLGAEVIKIESAAYPDGLRQTPPGMVMSRSWALTHRNEYSLGLDLRHPSGAALFEKLVAGADAVFANFKPGTLDSLGFSYQRLRELNPRIVLAESSAFGASGPWSERMGYGPLVRATTGVTWLWTSEDAPSGSFYDATTIFPDHVSARLTAIAAVAALIGRERTEAGARVHISQAEAAVNQLAITYVAEEARSAGQPLVDDPAVHRVYRCDGDDEWCVISLRDDSDRLALAAVTGGSDVSEWTRDRDKMDVAQALQRAGLAAGPMYRAVDVLADPQLTYRKIFSDMTHPLFDAPMPTETSPAPYLHILPAELRPAPMPGEHTREICQKLLAMDADEIDRLISEGILFTHQGKSN
jgi:crotonobetainyl-CoA:carnitine CoA-transferase CaiB-like acyl-CoA transferase